jgi:hypothetical protein
VSSEDKQIKVTDKRMFLPDGALREEYRFLDEKSTAAPSPAAPAEPAASREPASDLPRPAAAREMSPFMDGMDDLDGEPPPLEIPGAPPGLGATFYDLVAMLAEPVPFYLGDVGGAELPNGQSAENLEMAGLHIDLLDVLRQKTAGNLSAQENAFLEDLLYRMRVRYVQKTR